MIEKSTDIVKVIWDKFIVVNNDNLFTSECDIVNHYSDIMERCINGYKEKLVLYLIKVFDCRHL